jgi:hypothetical protein
MWILRSSSVTRPVWAGFVATALTIGASADRTHAAGTPKDTSVLLTFGNTAADRLTSDGTTVTVSGRTADYANGLQNVLSALQTSGNYRFSTENDTRLAAERRMCVDFGTQFNDQGLAVPFVDGQSRQCVNVLQPMHSYLTGDVAIQNLRYGQSVRKLTRFAWDDGGFMYRLGYGTDMDHDGAEDAPAVLVSCTAPADATKSCTQWVIAPETDPFGRPFGTAALFRFTVTYDHRGNPVVDESSGQLLTTVVMPFTETLVKQ